MTTDHSLPVRPLGDWHARTDPPRARARARAKRFHGI